MLSGSRDLSNESDSSREVPHLLTLAEPTAAVCIEIFFSSLPGFPKLATYDGSQVNSYEMGSDGKVPH